MLLLCCTCSFFNVHNEMQVAFQPANESTNTNSSGSKIVYLIDPHEPVDQLGKEIRDWLSAAAHDVWLGQLDGLCSGR
jgi:hypothetical protein